MLFRSNNQFVYFLKNADCNIYSNGQSVSDKKGNKNVHLQRGAKKILESNRARPPVGWGPEKLFVMTKRLVSLLKCCSGHTR